MASRLAEISMLTPSQDAIQQNIAKFVELFVAPSVQSLQAGLGPKEAWLEFTFRRGAGMRNLYVELGSKCLGNMQLLLGVQSRALTPSYFNLGFRARDLGRFKRGGVAEVVGIPALWLDIDLATGVHASTALPGSVEDVEHLLKEALPGRPPNVLVHSGGGIHAYWMFARPWFFNSEQDRLNARQQLRALHAHVQKAAAQHGWKLDNVSDLARMLRVPGTYNAKDPAAPKLVEIIACNM